MNPQQEKEFVKIIKKYTHYIQGGEYFELIDGFIPLEQFISKIQQQDRDKYIKELEELEKEILRILEEEYGHQDACERHPDRFCSCPIGLVADVLEDKIKALKDE